MVDFDIAAVRGGAEALGELFVFKVDDDLDGAFCGLDLGLADHIAVFVDLIDEECDIVEQCIIVVVLPYRCSVIRSGRGAGLFRSGVLAAVVCICIRGLVQSFHVGVVDFVPGLDPGDAESSVVRYCGAVIQDCVDLDAIMVVNVA